MVFDSGTIFICIGGVFLLYLCCRLFLTPIKWILRLGLSWLIGGGAILAFNFFGAFWNLHIALNPFTAMVTGVLGVPGMIMMLVLNFLKF